jgi:aminopeptidase
MDDRIERHAEVLVDHCTDVGPEDDVMIRAPTQAEDLVVALYDQLGKRGARPTTAWRSPRAGRAYTRVMGVEDFRAKEHRLAAMEETDAVILVIGETNTAEGSDVDSEKSAAAGRARGPILDARLDKRWVITQHPTPAHAQKAGMSTEAWTDFLYNAVNRDWAAQREFQEQMADVLDPADEVRIVSGEATDLHLSVTGMSVLNDDGEQNMPGGEVATCPTPDSVEGEVAFDIPLLHSGREIRDVRLTFENGEVTDHAASRNEGALTSVLETDDGVRRVGELGIGMNRGIDRITYSTLFDEKTGDTVHVALGNAMEECVPDDREFNESAIHVDMLVDMSTESRIEVDDEIVQRNGTFRFEEGFSE